MSPRKKFSPDELRNSLGFPRPGGDDEKSTKPPLPSWSYAVATITILVIYSVIVSIFVFCWNIVASRFKIPTIDWLEAACMLLMVKIVRFIGKSK